MKLAAVLVPLGFLALPTFGVVIYAVAKVISGKNVAIGGYPKVPRPLRINYLGGLAFLSAFAASIAWSVYIFTQEVMFSVLMGGGLVLTGVLAVWVNVFAKWIPKPPPEGFSSQRDYNLWLNKLVEAQGKVLLKGLKFYGLFILVLALVALLAIVVSLLVTAIAS